ncbi:Ras-related small GTP-binding family protein isoform 2 [Hibiscus syriacus]|uniref:Ras-related small GTP-binding family protein isoform 2 n=1 Tax=Hibiscus syriacus TaxID=106335 RepID=A0A6A2WZH4_HIBSY|nr:Ras-related small GTP-binding family protein isoform 2 [Hibiscus syriacus]
MNQKTMTRLCRKLVHANIKWSILGRASIFRRFFRLIWDRILVCSVGRRPVHYRKLTPRDSSPLEGVVVIGDDEDDEGEALTDKGYESDSDLVSLKISLLGDCQIGKTSFLIKYVGDEQEGSLEMSGLNLVNKTLFVQGARIAFSIWDVGGDSNSLDHLPIACKDSVAILFMFDLTSRCTLNSVVGWYSQARKWNQKAIPVLIGTKFDDFVKLPPDLQWTIVTQARAYVKAMRQPFSSQVLNITSM